MKLGNRKSNPLRRQRFGRRLGAETLEPRTLLASLPIITEFQAINRATILDEDGDSSDWVEISNPTAETIDLDGWYLTDDAADLNKWKFPSIAIDPGEALIVFASGKNRTESQELHTNFRLSGNGEFLALVQTDGTTVAQDFGVEFPAQLEDQSYGLAQARESTSLVDENSSVASFVPADDSLGVDWTQNQFDDSGWLEGTGAVGFENLRPMTTVREEFDVPLSAEWTVDLPDGATETVEVANGGLKFSVPNGKDTSLHDRGLAPIVYRDQPVADATDWEWVAHIQKENTGDRGPVGVMIVDGTTGKPALMLEQAVNQTFRFLSGGVEITWTQRQTGSFFLRLARNEIEKTWIASAKLAEGDEWHVIATVTDGTFEGPVVADPKPALYARTPSGTLDAQFLWVEYTAATQRPTYGPLIGLDVGGQMSGVNGSSYSRYEFQIEGDPSRFDVLNVGARYDDGFKAYLNGTEITSANSPIVSAWDSVASGMHGAVLNQIPLEQFEVTGSLGLLRSGENVLAIHGMNVTAGDPDFFFQGGLVASQIVTLEEREFTSPTPGEPNLAPNAPAPQLMEEDGIFFGSKTVELSLEQGASQTLEMRYTLDGTEPTADSQLYAGPFVITKTAMLQARTFDTLLAPDFQPSNVTSKTFIGLSEGLRERTSNMPLLVIDTLGQGIPTTNTSDLRRAGVVLLDINRATNEASLDNGIVDYLGRGGVRRRGSSTGAQAKPQLTFETWGSAGTNRDDDFDVSLLGMPDESDWVLHAPFGADPAFMRNRFGFELANQMGRWAPGTRFAEVYLNDGSGDIVSEDHYVGIYVLMEKIKEGPDRVDVADIDPEDDQEPAISGGYIWKVDRPDPDAPRFSAGGQSLNWVYPESPQSINARTDRKATDQQQQWVVDHFAEFQQTLVQPDINDPDGYTKYIDVDAWIDYHLMQAMLYNADAMGLSIFYHKDRNEKIAAGPLWDLNLTVESTRIDDDDPTLWRTGANFFGAPWWSDLARDPGFWQRYADRWNELRNSVLSDENISDVILGFAAEIGESAERNAARWPDNTFRDISGYNSGFLDGTFQGEVEHMRHWMSARTRFMDSLFTGEPEVLVDDTVLGNVKGIHVSAGQEIGFLSAPLEAFDDTKLVSGVPGETIASYFVPTNDELVDTWTLPAFDDSGWQSGPTGLGFDERDDLSELIGTEVRPQSVDENATNIFARILFEVPNLADASDSQLVLRMKYEDGYVAYINGTRVSRVNLRDNNFTWDATARNQGVEEAMEFEEVDISRYKTVLVQGTNVLALRVLNSSRSSREMLLLPELVLRTVHIERNPAATVYYTVDGTDPRGPDGGPSPSALEFTTGETLALQENTRIIVRNLDSLDRGHEAEVVLTDWSAAVQYDFVVSSTPLVISEINYNPAAPSDAESESIPDTDGDGIPDWTNEDFEFVEVHNPSENDANLVGMALSAGVEFDFLTGDIDTIVAGGFGLIVKNRAAFELRYGDNHPFLGEYTGRLDNNGELVELVDGAGAVLFAVSYGDNAPWPESPDGAGAALQLIDPAGTPTDEYGKHYRWRGSTEYGGSPGTLGGAPVGVVINEVLAHTDPPVIQSDSIELVNTTANPIDISGWYLSDSADDLLKFQIPAGTILNAGGYLVFDEGDFNRDAETDAFALSGTTGDDVWLVVANDSGQVTTFVDDVHFRASLNGESFGRSPNGSGRLAPMSRDTLGCGNTNPRVGPLVISEINYNPGEPSNDALAIDAKLVEDDLEFVEIHNPTSMAIDLTDWQVRGGVDLDFDAGTNLAAGDTLLVLSFNPDSPTNVNRIAAFRSHYGIDETVRLVGGWGGQLSDSGEIVRLERPDSPPPGNLVLIPRVIEDELLYDDRAPWSELADGGGRSLQRLAPVFFGDDVQSWMANFPTPGAVDFSSAILGDFDGDGQVHHGDVDILLNAVNSGSSVTYYDLDGSTTVDQIDVTFLVENVIGSFMGDTNFDGKVDSKDLNQLGISWQNTNCVGWSSGDFNGDDQVDARDLNTLGVNWQNGVIAAVAGADDNQRVPGRIPRAPLFFPGDNGTDGAHLISQNQNGLNASPAKAVIGRHTPQPLSRAVSAYVAPTIADRLFESEAMALERHQITVDDPSYLQRTLDKPVYIAVSKASSASTNRIGPKESANADVMHGPDMKTLDDIFAVLWRPR